MAEKSELEMLQDLVDSELHDILSAVFAADLPRPEVGYPLPGEGRITTEAEASMAWPELRIAVLSTEDAAHASEFERLEWKVYLHPAPKEELLEQLSCFGDKIGLAFQIIDDILDVEGDSTLLGKTVGADSNKQKATYPKVIGMENAKEEAEQLISEAIHLFSPDDDNYLKYLAEYIAQRKR